MNLNNQNLWSKIARPTERILVRTSSYQSLIDDVIQEIKLDLNELRKNDSEKVNVLDLGCGVGYLVDQLLECDPKINVTGVDLDPEMLRIAGEEIIKDQNRCQLIQEDVTKFKPNKKYNIVVSTNLLFSLANPFNFIANCYQLLKEGDFLVLSSMKENPDLETLLNIAQRELSSNETKKQIDIIKKASEEMMNSHFRTYSPERASHYLSHFCGFDVISCRTTYSDQNFLINARKQVQGKVVIDLESSAEAFKEAWALKYFHLAETNRVIPNDVKISSSTEYDQYSFLLTARDSKTNQLLGFQNTIMDSELGFPCERTTDISKFRGKYRNTLVSMAGTYVVPHMMGNRLAAFLMAYNHRLLLSRGIKASVAESNPKFVKFPMTIGYERYNGNSNGRTEEGLEKVDVFADLEQKRSQWEKVLESAYKKIGKDNLIINI